MKKTFSVYELLRIVNERNLKSICSADIRQGWNSLLEEVLHKTGNYSGYGYLEQKDVPEGCRPGIAKTSLGQRYFPDETRRLYYIKPELVNARTK